MANYQQDNQEVKPKRSPLDESMIKKIKGDAPVDDFYFNRGVKTYNQMMSRPGADASNAPEPQAADLERLGRATTNTSVMGAVGDIAKGVVTRTIPDAAAAIATTIDDPYTKGGIFDKFIDNRKNAQQEYINSAGADDIAIPFTTITRREMREGVSSLGFSAAAWGAARLGGAAAGAAVGSVAPIAGTITGAIVGFVGGAASAGALAYKMDKNAFIREYRSFLEQQKGQPLTDEEFAQYKSGKIADLLSEHGLHEAGWEGIATAIEQGTLARLGGGLTSRALKGIASLALFELGSEAGTQIGQSNVEVKLGMSDDQMRSYLEPKDWIASAREVLPAILVMSGVTGGVEAGVGYVQDKAKESRVNSLRQENLGLPTLTALANDPAAMRDRGLVQADVVTVARERVKSEFLTDIDERGYGPKELSEIKKDKDLMASAGITEEDIDTRIFEAEQEIATSKAAAVVDPEQEKLKVVSNKVANLSTIPNKTPEEEQRLTELQAERDDLINAGVQEPEAAKIAEESGEALATRYSNLSTQLEQINVASQKRKLTPTEQARKSDVETKINEIKDNKSFTDYVASIESAEAAEAAAGGTSAVDTEATKESLQVAPVPVVEPVKEPVVKESLTTDQVADASKKIKDIISERGFAGLRGSKNAKVRQQIIESIGGKGYGYATMLTKLKEHTGVTSTAPKDIERDVEAWAGAGAKAAVPSEDIKTVLRESGLDGLKGKTGEESRRRIAEMIDGQATKASGYSATVYKLMQHAGVSTEKDLVAWAGEKKAIEPAIKKNLPPSRVRKFNQGKGYEPVRVEFASDKDASAYDLSSRFGKAMRGKRSYNTDETQTLQGYRDNGYDVPTYERAVKEAAKVARLRDQETTIQAPRLEEFKIKPVESKQAPQPGLTKSDKSDIRNQLVSLNVNDKRAVRYYTASLLKGIPKPTIADIKSVSDKEMEQFLKEYSSRPEWQRDQVSSVLKQIGGMKDADTQDQRGGTDGDGRSVLQKGIIGSLFNRGFKGSGTTVFRDLGGLYGRRLREVCQAFRVTSHFWTSPDIGMNFINGFVDLSYPRNIFIRENATNPLHEVVAHEIGHSLQARFPLLYNSLYKNMFSNRANYAEYQARLKEIKDVLARSDVSPNVAVEDMDMYEYINDMLSAMLFDTQFQAELTKVNSDLSKTLAELASSDVDLSRFIQPDKVAEVRAQVVALLNGAFNEIKAGAKEGVGKQGLAFQMKDVGTAASAGEDSRYLALARDPVANREELQRMVDEAAKAAGFTVGPVYHGTDVKEPISVFRKGRKDENGLIFFTPSKKYAKRYTQIEGNIYGVFLKVDNVLDFGLDRTKKISSEIMDRSKAIGYDNALKEAGYDAVSYFNGREIAVPDKSQIKSADPVTYYKASDPEVISGEKQAGEVISLADRFNDTNDDIRFQDAVSPAGEPMGLDNVRRAFKGREVGEANDGGFWVKIRDGVFLTVKPVRDINQSVIEMEYGVSPTITKAKAGSYGQGKILLSTQYADRITLYHETFHALEDMNLVTQADQQVLNAAIRKAGIFVNWSDPLAAAEARAEFVGRGLQSRGDYASTPVGRVLQKIADFLDAMINAFHPTARGVMREIESGRVFQREGVAPSGATYFNSLAGTWYSEMEAVLSKKLPGKGTGTQMAAAIQSWAKKGEFKQDELEWSGLSEWLQGKDTVTKAEVLDWLTQNNVRVEEVVKGTPTDEEIETLMNDEVGENMDSVDARDYLMNEEGRPKFGPDTHPTMSLPGGTNYKELLITLPQKETSLNQDAQRVFGKNFADLNDEQIKMMESELKDPTNAYTGSHYNEKNILVHVRFNERTGPNGERVLFLEEVQSDWHQTGRNEGYHEKSKTVWVLEYSDGTKVGERYDSKAEAQAAVDELGLGDRIRVSEETEQKRVSGVPNAPFKGSKNWAMLAMKRMVRYAAENGFDVIAWTPGEVQAERYDLSKQISEVHYSGTNLTAYDHDGTAVVEKTGVAKEQLPDYIGKEAAERLLSQKPKGTLYSLVGEDLKVGGEGMKGFYDKILPAEVNAFFGKAKWGKAKVGSIEIPVAPIFPVKTINGDYVIKNSKGEFYYPVNKPGLSRVQWSNNAEDAEIFDDEQYALDEIENEIDEQVGEATTAHSLPITPEMKQKALFEGIPQFRDAPVVQFQDADVERFGVEQTRQRLAKWTDRQWKAFTAGAQRHPSAPLSTIAPADLKRGVLGYINSFLPFYAHTKKFVKAKEAHDTALEGQANQHRMNYADGEKTKVFYKDLKNKADKQIVMDLLDEEDVNGMYLTEEQVRGRGYSVPVIAAWKGMRGAINDRLKEMIRTTLPRTLVELGDENKEAAEIIYSAATREEMKTRMTAFLAERGMKLSAGELDHVSFLYDYMQSHKGYVPHKWEHPWRVRFSTKDGVVIRDFPLGISAVHLMEEQRTAAAVKHAEMLVAEEMGWTEAEIKQAQANSDMIEGMITRKRELVAAKKDIRDKDEVKALNKEMAVLQKEIDKILENEPTFKVIHSREMPTDYFEGARPEQMMSIISKSLDATMEKLGAKGQDVEELFDSIEGQVQAEMELMYLKKGSLKSLIQRKNIKGYRKDFDNVIAEYLTETASAMSKMNMARKFSKTLASIDPTRQPALWQEIKDYIKDILAPTPEATLFKKTAGILYLGADLSAVILNGTQNFTHGVGVLSTIPQGKGGGNAVTQIIGAEKDIANAWIQSKKSGEDFLMYPSGRITNDELVILKNLKSSGKLDPQLLGEQTGFKVNQIAEDQRVMTYMFKLFGAAEGMNRLSLALAVSRRALSAGKTIEEATEIAANAVHKAHFPYGRSNRPKLVRALDRATGRLAAGSVAWTFMTYPMMNIVYIRDNVWDAMEGVYKGDKVQARNAMKMIGSQLAFTMLFGGMTALPFYGLAQSIAAIFGDDGDDDWETMIRRQVDGILGEDAARGVTRGVPAMMKLFDMSQSVEGTDVFQTPIGLQVIGNMKKRLGESWDMYGHEEYLPAVFHLTPDFSRNIYRAFMGMEKGGEHRFAPPIKYTPGEAMTRAVGLTPVRESEAYKKAGAALSVQEKRTGMINDMARRVSNDRTNIREVRKEMNQYNRKGLPRIVWNDILKSMKRQKEDRKKNMTDRPAKYMDKYGKELDKVYGG